MINNVAVITLLVEDQDQALAFYTNKVGLELNTDTMLGEDMRWLTVSPPGNRDLQIFLALPFNEDQKACVGKNPTWSFSTDDCEADYERMKSNGVEFVQPPTERQWGTEAIFKDLYGNTFSLNQAAGKV